MASDKKPGKKQEIKWGAVLWYIHLHFLGLYALWLTLTSAKWMTVFFTLFITMIGSLGVTAGAHRLWAHRSFEASTMLRTFLILAHTLAGVGSVYDWVLYHRLHHKFHGTDKDPYNHNKGFLYSHYVGNFQSPKVDYEEAKREVDMRDMDNDSLVWVQYKFYWLIFGVFGLLLPLNAPLEYWDESMANVVLITGILRFAITANISWLVNSALLIWGDSGNNSKSSISVFAITKSNWPNYHYMVPWDWKTSEFGKYDEGCGTFFIKMWGEMGFAKKMRTTSAEDVGEFLHQVATKKTTLEEGLRHLEEMAVYNATKELLEIKK
nr:acyl-CoA Delta(11) desaturase isoform X1 [Megalopta genalis]XP_033329814.1 acyl-CoA Delta(11) desaturase isoform X1 [Megalopta genalis]